MTNGQVPNPVRHLRRPVEDRIRTLCQRLIESDENSDAFLAISADLQAACPNKSDKCVTDSNTTLWPERGGRQNSEIKVLNSAQNVRLKELTDLIEKERDPEKFTKLIAELNALLDEQEKPVSKTPSE